MENTTFGDPYKYKSLFYINEKLKEMDVKKRSRAVAVLIQFNNSMRDLEKYIIDPKIFSDFLPYTFDPSKDQFQKAKENYYKHLVDFNKIQA